MRTWATRLLVLGLQLGASSARAQGVEETAASETEPEVRVLPSDPCMRLTLAFSELGTAEARGSCLADTRLADRQDRIDEGVLLLGWGLMNAIAGGAIAGVGGSDRDDYWLAVGIGTGGWGLVNAALALTLLDLGGAGLRAIEEARGLSGESLERAREDAAAAQYQTGTLLAVNAGLDVLYVVSGILMWVIGQQSAPEERALMGYGAAMAAQGTALLGYDVVTWLFATARGERLRTLLRER